MRKIKNNATFILIILLIVTANKLYSQRFHGGLLFGVTASQIDGDSYGGYHKMGIMGGVFVNTEFREKWSGQMEIKYIEKGSAATKYDDNPSRRFKFSYIEIPVIGKYEAYKNLYIVGGATLGYLFKSGQDDGYGYENFLYEKPLDFELGLTMGATYALLENLDVDLRFGYSLHPVLNRYQEYGGYGPWYHNLFKFGFYYYIGGRE